jgi:deoxyribodipyrimidine photo-lyase
MPMTPRPPHRFTHGLVWFRRDLRAHDHAALYHALKTCERVHCVFVFDTDILDPLPRADRRVAFLHASVGDLAQQLQTMGNTELIVGHGCAQTLIPELARHLNVQAVFLNHDFEPSAKARDAQVRGSLAHSGIAMHSFKDHVVFEHDEVLTQAGRPFTVFTPYKNAWLKALTPFHLQPYPTQRYAQALAPVPATLPPRMNVAPAMPSLQDMGFEPVDLPGLHIQTGTQGARALLADFLLRMDLYDQTRDFPAIKGPSYLSVHLRFGTLSIRELAASAWPRAQAGVTGAATWLGELIWRDFYMQILDHFPHVVDDSFKREYDRIAWDHGPHGKHLFSQWCAGHTGYPLVDAAMRQLNHSGYMHNRLRMVVASFLTKDLGVDWRWGERYFAQHLIDFDLAANNGGWQWAASSGCDAQPYFRIFNPVTQSQRFDAQGKFIRRYVPELAGLSDKAIHAPWLAGAIELASAEVHLGKNYPHPIVDHAVARQTTLDRYAVVKTEVKPTVLRHHPD